MKDSGGNPWDGGARKFARYADTPTGRLRFTLIGETLLRHLPPPPLRVLDAGCGPAEMAILLAERGDVVTAVDCAGEMLRIAGERAERLTPAAQARLHLAHGDLFEADTLWPAESFDLLIAHTLLDYLPDGCDLLARLLKLLRAGGMISLVRINQASQVLRAALNSHDLDAAVRSLTDPTVQASMFGLAGTGSTASQAAEQLARAGVELVATYGIRALADYLPACLCDEPAQYAELLRLERAVCDQSPYREMARYIHLVGAKPLS